MRRVLLILGLMAMAAWAIAQFSNSGRVLGFKLPEFFEIGEGRTNRTLKTLITGAEARPAAAGVVSVKDMRIETFVPTGATNIIALAPVCEVDLRNRVAWSTGRLDVASANGQFSVHGDEGFYCEMATSSIIISNKVRTIIRRDLMEQSANEPQIR